MEEWNTFNLTAFTNPTSLLEVNALLDEVLSMVDELGGQLACMGKALEEAWYAGKEQ